MKHSFKPKSFLLVIVANSSEPIVKSAGEIPDHMDLLKESIADGVSYIYTHEFGGSFYPK